jgi:hypothetical protein
MGMQGAPGDGRPGIEHRSCHGCNRPDQECVRFGRSFFLCIACEELMKRKLKIILKFQ